MASMNWKEPDTKIKFLVAVLASNDSAAVKDAKASQIAEYMGCTAKAVSHQLTALRKEIESLKTGNFVSGAAGNGTPKGGASAKKRKTKDNSGDDVDDAGTPSKKSKTPKKSTTKTKAKKETNMDEEDEDVAARKDAADGREGEEEGDEDED
ncbi:hypothetical protein PMZ80_001281 [Knufia obscura]|uniref:Uncharacterized protein n=2 Tax=Knufia TaxID=430999 RepID=A0AAN8I7R6_9EURO|nr:hypothetical protein PMZ80_001281 [Knufia obscura]KAK5956314.1 hypothetical protein OHC33_002890 [Knufia fluminis]